MAKNKPEKNKVKFDDNDKNFPGTSAIDIVKGNDLNNKISGKGGDDKLSGNGGDDRLNGDGGNDTLKGGDGNDVLTGGAGNDELWGGAGNDTMLGGAGDDTFHADGGDDTIDGGTSTGDADTVIIGGNFADATITLSNGVYSIKTATGTISVSNVELFQFADGTKTAGQLIPAPPQSYILKAEPDLITGSTGDNVFVGTETTLSSADDLDGAEGTDTLQYSSSGAAAVVESGFKTKNIENFLVTSDAVGGTTFDVTGVTGAKNITNNNSSTNLTITGLKAVTDVGMTDVSGGDTKVVYQDAALAGAADIQNVTLNGNGDLAGDEISTLTIGSAGGTTGIETLNITSSGAASALVDIVTGAKTINISGDADLFVNNILDGATVIDASKATGDVSVAADSGILAVAVTGGAGDDYADFSAGFGAGDKYDGGAGKDAIGLTNAIATSGVLGGTVANVEVLAVTDAANGTIDMDKFTGINEVHLDGGIAAATTATIKNAATGLIVELDTKLTGANGSLIVDQKVDGTADTVTLNIDRIFKGDSYGIINLDDAETVNISLKDEDNTPGNVGLGGITVADLQVADATAINFSGDADITITDIDGNIDPTKNTLVTLDASKMTGDFKITGLGGATGVLSTAGATITLGAGNDSLLDGTGLGADTVTLGGGKDVVVYNNVNQSSGAKVDTITDFVSGTDDIDLKALGINSVSQFTGTFATFAAAQGSIAAGGAIEAVFQADTSTLWVDVNNDGALNANDLQVILKGVTSIKGTDLNLNGVGVTYTAKVVGFDTAVAAESVENVTTTDEADTIIATAAQLVGADVDGKLGNDTLKVTTAVNQNFDEADYLNVESLVLANGVNTVTFSGASTEFKNVTGGTGVDNVDTTDLDNGGTIATLGGNDVVILSQTLAEDTAAADVSVGATTIDLGEGDDKLTVSAATLADGIYKMTLTGGAGTDTLDVDADLDLSSGTVTAFENLDLANNVDLKATVDQINQFTGTVVGGGTNIITLTTAGAITALANVEDYVFSSLGNKLTVNGDTVNVTGNAGNDEVVGTNADIAGLTSFNGGTGGFDTITITDGVGAGVDLSAIAGITKVDSIVVTGASAAGTLKVDDGNGVTDIDASGVTGGGITVDISALTTTNGDTLVTLTAGNDVLATGIDNSGGNDLTIDFGTGNATVADVKANGAGVFIFEIDAKASISTAVVITTTTADLASGDVFDFNTDIAGITTTASNIAGQVIITDDTTDTTIHWDVDGNGIISTGDVVVTVEDQVLGLGNFSVIDGNLHIA